MYISENHDSLTLSSFQTTPLDDCQSQLHMYIIVTLIWKSRYSKTEFWYLSSKQFMRIFVVEISVNLKFWTFVRLLRTKTLSLILLNYIWFTVSNYSIKHFLNNDFKEKNQEGKFQFYLLFFFQKFDIFRNKDYHKQLIRVIKNKYIV